MYINQIYINSSTVIIEDLQDFKKLTDLVAYGVDIEEYIPAIEKALYFIGYVHRETFLAEKTLEERKLLYDKFRYHNMA